MSTSLTSQTSHAALLTDLYELSMMSAYYELGMEQTAVFELFVRHLPHQRNFLVAAGLEQVLHYLEHLQFTAEDIAWLESTGRFKQAFLDRLSTFRFTGDVHAMREGTVFFDDEPILRITAPMPQAQLLESRLINLLHFQTLIASKAARCRIAAGKHTLIDFGMRRAHGAEAALLAARASYIAGFDATSNVQAGQLFGIPLSGTMAHSFVEAHDSELDAFRNFARCHPHNLTLLIDTYDTCRCARRVVELAASLAAQGIKIKSVRIDSGDLDVVTRQVRVILDQGGCHDIGIFVSGGIDEQQIAALLRNGAPIDGFGVGTALTTSFDAAALDCAYKLQQYAGTPRRKSSQSKQTWPGRRQVYRLHDDHGRIAMDVVGCADEILEGKLLLQPVMINGCRMAASPSLQQIRQHCATEIATLPGNSLSVSDFSSSPVIISHGLREMARELDQLTH